MIAKRWSLLFPSLMAVLVTALAWSFMVPTHAQTAVPDQPTGFLRVVNALVGLGRVDVYLNDQHLAYGLEPEAATVYFAVTPGMYSLSVRPAGADRFSAPIADVLIDVTPGQSLSALAYQKIFSSADYVPPVSQSGAIFVMTDDRSMTSIGKTRLSAVHLAVGAPPQLSVGYPQALLLGQVGFEQPYGDIDLDAGQYNLTLIDGSSADQSVIERIGDQRFSGSTLYTLVMVPDVQPAVTTGTNRVQVSSASNNSRLFIVSAPLIPDPEGFRLRFIHAAFNFQALDLYIDDELTIPGIGYSGYSEYLALPNSRHTVTLRRLGAAPDSEPLSEAVFTLPDEQEEQDNWTLLLLNGNQRNEAAVQQSQAVHESFPLAISEPGSRIVMSVSPDNLSQTNQYYSRVRLYHAVDDLPPMGLFSPENMLYDPLPGVLETPVPTLDPLLGSPGLKSLVNQSLYSGIAGESEIRTGLYSQFDVLLSNSGSEIQSLPGLHFVPGMIYTQVVIGSPSSNPPIQVLTISDFGVGAPVFMPGQLPTPTAIPVIVTRIPPTSSPSTEIVQPSPVPQQNNQAGGQGNNQGNNNQVPQPTAIVPTAVPPTSIPPTSIPPTSIPPTSIPPTSIPPTAEPPTTEPPTSQPPTAEPTAGGTTIDLPILPPIELPPILPTSGGG